MYGEPLANFCRGVSERGVVSGAQRASWRG